MTKETISRYLENGCKGHKNVVSSRELERALGISGNELRRHINRLRRGTVPIAADQRGYYYAETAAEVYATIRSLEKMRSGVDAAISGLSGRWRNSVSRQMTKLMPWVGGKAQLMWAIQMLLPTHYKTLVDVFGGSGIITMNTSVPSGCLQIYNDLNHDLYNLLFCAKERPLELVRELGFLPINAHDEFDVLQRQLRGEDFTMEYMERQLDLTEVFFEPPQAEVVRQLLLERGSLGNVRRAAAFYKLQRYSYNGSGDSYGVGSCDIRRFFRDLWECSHRLKDAVLENKDFESIITARNDPQTVVYCDPPYYEAECYTVEFPRSDHQRLHDVLVKHTGFAMVSYNNCPYIRELYDDFFIYEVERPNSQSKKKNNKYREYIMTNYDPRTFAPQMSFFGDYDSRGKSCRLVHTPQRPLKV